LKRNWKEQRTGRKEYHKRRGLLLGRRGSKGQRREGQGSARRGRRKRLKGIVKEKILRVERVEKRHSGGPRWVRGGNIERHRIQGRMFEPIRSEKRGDTGNVALKTENQEGGCYRASFFSDVG